MDSIIYYEFNIDIARIFYGIRFRILLFMLQTNNKCTCHIYQKKKMTTKIFRQYVIKREELVQAQISHFYNLNASAHIPMFHKSN